jgi:hypothetical protein
MRRTLISRLQENKRVPLQWTLHRKGRQVHRSFLA